MGLVRSQQRSSQKAIRAALPSAHRAMSPVPEVLCLASGTSGRGRSLQVPDPVFR